ncbi:MAG: N-acetylmuramoyl-L-alanine amidase [Verrucomicrobiales bacterium]|nr:N-acetylmuramoyl-L-alanine amidase [Verrucomicrobiales bacterium]
MKTIALIIGHEPNAQGAVDVSGVSEYVYNKALVEKIARRLDHAKPLVVYREHGYARLPDDVNATGADLAVECHFNAADGRASGTEVLYWHKSARGQAAAALLQKHLVAALGLPDRGPKPRTAADRGGPLLRGTAMPCLIAEPFFGDNPLDWRRAVVREQELINAYAAAIHEICGQVL